MGMTSSTVALIDTISGGGRWLLANLGGSPLVAHVIRAACAAGSIDRVAVLTQDADVAAVASSQCADVIAAQRSGLGAAHPSLEGAVAALRLADREAGVAVVVAGNAPFLEAADIDGTVAALCRENADAACALTPCRHAVWRSNGDGTAAVDRLSTAPGAPAAAYKDSGAIHAVRVATWKGFGAGKTAVHVMPGERCRRVDGEEDLLIATMLMARQSRTRIASHLPARPAALIMDFDGVFTDNRVFVDQDGRETVACSRGDGLGLERLRKLGLPMLVLSKEKNPVVAARCAKLALECLQGIDDKRPALEAWCRHRTIPLADAVYVGNDINDLPCFQVVGCAVAVADSHPDALSAAHCVLSHPGGRGALRELADLLIERLSRCENDL